MALYFELDLGSLSLGRTSKSWFLEEFGFLSMNLFCGICINICFLSEANIAVQSLWLQMRKLAYRERNGDLLLFKMLTFLFSRYNEFEVLWRFMPKEKCQKLSVPSSTSPQVPEGRSSVFTSEVPPPSASQTRWLFQFLKRGMFIFAQGLRFG